MRTLLIGIYSGSGRYGDWNASTALFESPYADPEQLKNKLQALALEERRREQADGWDMTYDYNFGNVIDMCDEPEFAAVLAANGIKLLPFGEDIVVDILEHDEIWVSEDDVKNL